MNKLFDMIKAEPVFFFAVVQAGVTMLTTFGLQLTPAQIGSILLFTSTVLTFITRKQVTPNPVVEQRVEDALNTPVPPTHTVKNPMDQLEKE